MTFIELGYYLIANFVFLVPLSFLLLRKQVVFLPATFYLFFSWLFLVLGIPFANDVSVLGGYSFSYSFIYLIVLIMIASPVYLYYLIVNSFYDKNLYLSSLNPEGVLGFYYSLWVITLFGVFSYIFLHGLPPIFSALSLSGNSSDVYALRMEVTYGSNYRRFDVFFVLIPAIATLLSAFLYKTRKVSRLHFFIAIAMYLVLSFAFLHKSHMIVFVLALAVVFYLFSDKKIINFFLIPLLISIALLLITYIFYIGTVNYGYGDLLVMIFERIVIPYVVSLDFVLQNFGETVPLLMGVSFPNPKGIFDFEPVYFSNLMMNLLAGKVEGTVPAPAVGFLYANFGFLGVLVNSLWVLLYFLFLQWLMKNFKSPVGLVVWVYLAVSVFNFSIRDPFGIIDLWVFIILINYLIWKFFLSAYKKYNQYRT